MNPLHIAEQAGLYQVQRVHDGVCVECVSEGWQSLDDLAGWAAGWGHRKIFAMVHELRVAAMEAA